MSRNRAGRCQVCKGAKIVDVLGGLLKRMSCSGCERCQQIWDDISMCGDVWDMFKEVEGPVPGAVYEAVFRSGSPDWETGLVDEWWWDLERRSEL